MNSRAASLTAGHREPIEPDTSRTSDRSTMRRCASPVLVTVTSLKLASRMNVVGTTAVARTVTTLTPVSIDRVACRRSWLGRRVRHRRRAHVAVREVGPEDLLRLGARVAAVQVARRRERGAVHRLGQLRLHDVGPAAVDRQPGGNQQEREEDGHVDQGEPAFAGSAWHRRDASLSVISIPLSEPCQRLALPTC